VVTQIVLSEAQKYRMLERAGFAGQAWDQVVPDAGLRALLGAGRMMEALEDIKDRADAEDEAAFGHGVHGCDLLRQVHRH